MHGEHLRKREQHAASESPTPAPRFTRVAGAVLWIAALGATAACAWMVAQVYGELRRDLSERYRSQQQVIAAEVVAMVQARVAGTSQELDDLIHDLCEHRVADQTTLAAALREWLHESGRAELGAVFALDAQGGVLGATGPSDAASWRDLQRAPVGTSPGGARLYETRSMKGGEPASGTALLVAREMGVRGCLPEVEEVAAPIPLDEILASPLGGPGAARGTVVWIQTRAGRVLYHSSDPAQVGTDAFSTIARCARCHLEDGELRKETMSRRPEPDVAMVSANLGGPESALSVLVTTPHETVSELLDQRLGEMLGLMLVVVGLLLTALLATGAVFLVGARARGQALHAQREERERLERILSGLGVGVFVMDSGRRITWANRVAADWFGGTDGLKGRSCCEVLHEPSQPCTFCPIDRQAGGGRPVHARRTIEGSSGRRVYGITATPVRDPSDRVSEVLHVLQDLSEQVELEEQVARAERLASLGRLAAGVAHEVGNPLTSMSSFIQILLERDQDDFTRKSLEKVFGQVQRIDRIVRRLGNLARGPDASLGPVMVDRCLLSALEVVEYDKRFSEVELQFALSGDLPQVMSNASQLQQVFINLLLNAMDAMEEGGELELGASERRGTGDRSRLDGVVAWVRDTGAGIPKEIIHRVMDPFVTTKDVGKGTGLGLAISYSIVQSYGGTIHIDSKPGEGTRVEVWLPRRGGAEAAT